MKDGVSIVTLDALIEAALTGKPYNQQRLGTQAKLYARRISKARADDLPEDLHEEVFTQAFTELLQVGATVLELRSGKAAFRRAVYAAIRAVRASYAPPGRRTRSTLPTRQECVAAEDIGRITDAATLERCAIEEGGHVAHDFDLLASASAAAAMQQGEDAMVVEDILAHAPRKVAWAMRLIHMNDEPVDQVAAMAGLSRFALHRRISAFCAVWRAAA